MRRHEELAADREPGLVGREPILPARKKIYETKLKCLDLLFDAQPALDTFLSSFNESDDVGVARGSSASKSASAKVMHDMGTAPPCDKYQDLVVFQMIEHQIREVMSANSAQDIEKIKKDLIATLVPSRNLIAACKQAKIDLERRRKTFHEKLLEQSKAQQARVDKQGDGVAFFEAMEKCLPGLKTLAWGDLATTDWDQPFIITGFTVDKLPTEIANVLETFKDATWPKAVKDAGSKKLRRGADALPHHLQDSLRVHIMECLHINTIHCKSPPEMSKLFEPQVFAINGDVFSLASEAKCLPMLRFGFFGGTRKIAVASLAGMRDLMLQNAPVEQAATPTTPAQVRAFWKAKASDEEVSKNMAPIAEAAIGTVGPGDCIYLPPGALVAEKTQADACFGLKCSALLFKDIMLPLLNRLLGALPASGEEHQLIQNVHDDLKSELARLDTKQNSCSTVVAQTHGLDPQATPAELGHIAEEGALASTAVPAVVEQSLQGALASTALPAVVAQGEVGALHSAAAPAVGAQSEQGALASIAVPAVGALDSVAAPAVGALPLDSVVGSVVIVSI